MLHNPLGLRLGHPLHLAKFPPKKFQNVPWCPGSTLQVIWVARHENFSSLRIGNIARVWGFSGAMWRSPSRRLGLQWSGRTQFTAAAVSLAE